MTLVIYTAFFTQFSRVVSTAHTKAAQLEAGVAKALTLVSSQAGKAARAELNSTALATATPKAGALAEEVVVLEAQVESLKAVTAAAAKRLSIIKCPLYLHEESAQAQVTLLN